MKEDRFGYNTKKVREYADFPGPGHYGDIRCTGVGESQCLSTKETVPMCKFGSESRFYQKAGGAPKGQDSDADVVRINGRVVKMKVNKAILENNATRITPGPGAYFKNEINTAFGAQQRSCRKSEPRYARQCEVRLAPEPGPHNRTFQILSNQPGPGSYETVTGGMGKDPIKRSSPGFMFGRGFMHDIADEHELRNLMQPTYEKRPQSARVVHRVATVAPRPQSAVIPTTHMRDPHARKEPVPRLNQLSAGSGASSPKRSTNRAPPSGRPWSAPRPRPASAQPPRSHAWRISAQESPKRPASARNTGNKAAEYGLRSPRGGAHPMSPASGADFHGEFMEDIAEDDAPLESPFGQRYGGGRGSSRPLSAPRYSSPHSPRGGGAVRPRSAHPTAAGSLTGTPGGIRPSAFKKEVLGTRYWETSPIRQSRHPFGVGGPEEVDGDGDPGSLFM